MAILSAIGVAVAGAFSVTLVAGSAAAIAVGLAVVAVVVGVIGFLVTGLSRVWGL